MAVKRILAVILLCFLAVSALGACRKLEKNDDKTNDTTVNEHNKDIISLLGEDDSVSGEIEISTPYVSLKYPEKWLNYLKTEKNFSTGNSVTFFARLDGKEEKELFTVYFNEDGEFPLGVLDVSGESVYVAFSYAELKFDETWTQAEQEVVLAMQEQINWISEGLSKESNFTPED